MNVRPKKHLGQHFLKDETVCQRIAEAIQPDGKYTKVLEIGPGMGAFTKYLMKRIDFETSVIEIDRESVAYLKVNFPDLTDRIFANDFLHTDPREIMGTDTFAVVGNFPYNISTQILFRVLDFKDNIPEVVGMFQKEVAVRIAEGPGSKDYGIVSVLLQAFYDIEYLFTVDEHVFIPPPKVKSGVIRLKRNNVKNLACDEKLFKQVVKQAFSQRRKTLRNSLKPFQDGFPAFFESHKELLQRRPETLSVEEFVYITQQFQV
ncbi:MAG: 16S rRNA (adenine(1518)-N(6)/adenine(1519)-N(6))-dimethyltransferase RsmA [Crocinitomicaceae bacterium]|nr:16S rRNA (adenine(1518)-N(6)/adenine(1519)-N(6))-dimethyltransferase RsmA [Crocinitomicaceae bacterium]